MSVERLLVEVDKLFPQKKSKGPECYNYSLGKFPSGWQFNLTNNWYAWSDKKLETRWGLYQRPEYAVAAFLEYVRKNKINVKKMCHKS